MDGGDPRLERRKRQAMGAHKKLVRSLILELVPQEDYPKVAKRLCIKERTFESKVRYGRFSAAELSFISYMYGYELVMRKTEWKTPE